MQLSPYTQYYVRQLLRRSVKRLNYPLSGIGISSYFQTSVEQVLKRNDSTQSDLKAKMRELETLVQFHQRHVTNRTYSYETSFEIEHQILSLLGLKFLVFLSTLSLTTVPETAAALFHFVLADQMHQGIRYCDDLYGLVREFAEEQDFASHHLLLKLHDRQVPFILTASDTRHGIWVSLRSPMYYKLRKTESALLQTA